MRNIRNKKMKKTSNNQLSNTTYANSIKNCTLWILIVALVITPMQYQSYILRQKIQKLEEEYKTKNVNVNQKYPVAGVSNLLNDTMEKNNTVSISKLDNDILTASYVDTIVLLDNIIKEGEKNKEL